MLSGKFSDLSLDEYMARVSQYFPLYLTSTLNYCISIFADVNQLSKILSDKVNVINRYN